MATPAMAPPPQLAGRMSGHAPNVNEERRLTPWSLTRQWRSRGGVCGTGRQRRDTRRHALTSCPPMASAPVVDILSGRAAEQGGDMLADTCHERRTRCRWPRWTCPSPTWPSRSWRSTWPRDGDDTAPLAPAAMGGVTAPWPCPASLTFCPSHWRECHVRGCRRRERRDMSGDDMFGGHRWPCHRRKPLSVRAGGGAPSAGTVGLAREGSSDARRERQLREPL